MNSHIIDPDKLATILRVNWFHPKISRGHHNIEPEEQTDSYSFFMEPTGVELSFSLSHPKDIRLWPGETNPDDSTFITFKNITDVYYFISPPVFVAESVTDKYFSEIKILVTGEFHITINMLTEEYSNSFANKYENLKGAYRL